MARSFIMENENAYTIYICIDIRINQKDIYTHRFYFEMGLNRAKGTKIQRIFQ